MSDIDDNSLKYDHNGDDIIVTMGIRPSLSRRMGLKWRRVPVHAKLLLGITLCGLSFLLANYFDILPSDFSLDSVYQSYNGFSGAALVPEIAPVNTNGTTADLKAVGEPVAPTGLAEYDVKSSVPVNICVVTDHYFGKYQYNSKQESSCGMNSPCTIIDTPKRTCKKSADALWFHIPHTSKSEILRYKDTAKGKRQFFVGMSMESAGYYDDMKDPSYMALFNITMTYRLDSDIVTHYFSDRESFYSMPNASEHRLDEVAYINSNCFTPNHRNTFVRELMKLYPVKSYGKCLHNMSGTKQQSDEFAEPENLSEAPQVDKMATLRQHKFCIAIENTNERDYVSEKLWQTFEAGCLPIIAGPINVVEDFLPHPKAAIVIDIETTIVEDLTELLRRLASDPTEYAKYMEWRTMPKDKLSKGYLRLLALQKRPSTQCQLCRKVAELRRAREKSLQKPGS